MDAVHCGVYARRSILSFSICLPECIRLLNLVSCVNGFHDGDSRKDFFF